MESLFGAPIGGLLAVLAAVFAAGAALLAALALRNRVAFAMGVRNVPRRRAQTVLVVAGLMLATVIFSVSLVTGDTLTHSVRVLALGELGQVDVIVEPEAQDASGRTPYFEQSRFDEVRAALDDLPEVEGVAPMIRESVPAVAADSRLSEPAVTLLGLDPAWSEGFDRPVGVDGETLDVEALAPGQVYISEELAESLEVTTGAEVLVFLGPSPTPLTVAAVYREGVNPAGELSALLPLDQVQAAGGNGEGINGIIIGNRGDAIAGEQGTDAVLAALAPVLEGTGLEADPVKRDALDEANRAGAEASSIFLLFGQFSVAAGILLIFLIFVMLAAERKHEMGVARAVGMQRGDLVRMFVFEGTMYALLAAAVGTVLGLVVGWGMVRLLTDAFSQADVELVYNVRWQSLALAYILGMVLTFAVVAASAWWVSRLNIVRAIRDIPEPRRRRRSWRALVFGALLPVLGVLLTVSGLQAAQGGVFMLGTSLVVIGAALVARLAGVPDRAAFTTAGLALVVWWLLPAEALAWLIPALPEFEMGIEMFFLSGIMVVIGAVWTIIYNSDLLLGAVVTAFGRVPGLPSILRTAVSYPMQNRFRTGLTLTMFSLVVFTLVVMSFILNGVATVYEDTDRIAGGFDVRAAVSPANPIPDLDAALRDAEGVAPDDFAAVGAVSAAAVDAKQAGTAAEPEEAVLQGVDRGYSEAVTYDFAVTAQGYDSAEEVWRALQEEPGTVVVASYMVPRRVAFGAGGIQPPFMLEGFVFEDEVIPEGISIAVVDPASGREMELRVIGVLESTALYTDAMVTSADTLASLQGAPVPAFGYMMRLAEGRDAEATARALRAGLTEHGVQAESLAEEVREAAEANLTINTLLQGFMGLGLVVGIAALGVVAARSVVERRQEIGVMRALGFQREMVQASFLMESSFIALLGIAIGTALAGALSYSIISEMSEEFTGLTYEVPWLNILGVAVIAYGASLLTTFLPAYQASRVRPAETLRFE